MVVRKASMMLRRWKSLCRETEELRLGEILEDVDRRAARPLCIGWTMSGLQAVPEAQTLAETGAGKTSGFGVSMGSEAAAEDMPFSFALDEYAVNCLFCYKRLEMFLFPGNENRGPPFL